jgi:nicotinic acid phosphoribosyltransferase
VLKKIFLLKAFGTMAHEIVFRNDQLLTVKRMYITGNKYCIIIVLDNLMNIS